MKELLGRVSHRELRDIAKLAPECLRILTLLESPERTQAIQTFIKEIRPLDQEAANEWAKLLPE